LRQLVEHSTERDGGVTSLQAVEPWPDGKGLQNEEDMAVVEKKLFQQRWGMHKKPGRSGQEVGRRWAKNLDFSVGGRGRLRV